MKKNKKYKWNDLFVFGSKTPTGDYPRRHLNEMRPMRYKLTKGLDKQSIKV